MTFTTLMPLYRGMDAATLDREYNARASVPSFEAEAAAYVRESARVQQELAGFETVTYDERTGEKLDLYGVAPGRPVFLWVHGGYWRGGSRNDNAFAAGGLPRHGVTVAVMDYTLAPTVGISEIVRQVRAAVVWLARHGAERGLNVERIHVGGSSAGGHLTGMLLTDGWAREAGLRDDIIGAALALSGLYDLEPLQHMHVNTWMSFTADDIAQCSPQRWIPRLSKSRLIASVGGLESSEFRRQTVDYAQRWKEAGNAVELIDMPQYNHFDIARSLVDPDGVLVRAVARVIKAIHHA
ncbi:alpha/beta hydrolase [Burkholderia pseudomallei]|uniref:alpha/beta hydrolase n=1 Tax=Burkholderia pseudomallei TaxID=28450 RepID=UPI0004F7148D|nr:alpha/beta hydrolase [Burkholderia pseudomallei]AIP10923.1 alpha/beta hydrolase fold family protein [Burkholderia pseudomallei]